MKTTRLETRTKEFWSYASVMVQVKPKTRSESKYTIYLFVVYMAHYFCFSLCFSFSFFDSFVNMFLFCWFALLQSVREYKQQDRIQSK